MRNFILLLLISFFTNTFMFAQLESSYLETFKKKPKSFTLDILEQKKNDSETFKTYKHKRYELSLSEAAIESQKVYDTMSNVAYNKDITYKYDTSIDKNLIEVIQNKFNGELQKRSVYTYDDRALLLEKEEQYDKDNDILQTIVHSFGACEDKSVYKDLSEVYTYTCAIEEFKNRASSRKTVKVYGDMGELVKELRYKKDGTLSVTERTTYTEEGLVATVHKETSSGSSFKTIYTYNEQGDRIKTKASYVEFYYEYEYDKHGNWTL